MKKCLFALDAYVVSCPTQSKNLERTLVVMSCPILLWGLFFPVKLPFAIQDDFIFIGVSKIVVKLSKLYFLVVFFYLRRLN